MSKRSFYIRESELDSFQLLVLQRKIDKPTLVKGSAGSGKSIIALHRVKQIQEGDIGSFYFILFTKTLKQYMKDGIHILGLNNDKVVYHSEWKTRLNTPSADYIIVDEIQDFSEQDIQLFQSKANKALIMFGDSAQQLYAFRQDNPPISVEHIAYLTTIPTNDLVFNYRLPKKIARLAEFISDSDDLEERCQNEGVEYPKILQFNNLHEQFDKIIEIINSRQLEDVGVLFAYNHQVEYAYKYFNSKNLNVEAKYNDSMDLDFNNNLPKLTTYHSSKGLQFEAVFIPNCEDAHIIHPFPKPHTMAKEIESKKRALYVAITRTYQSLFIMHSGHLSNFFANVPNNIYQTSLETKRSRRL